MYSTSPSSSSMASSSGRSSPEHPSQSAAAGPQPQRSNSFLLPQFFWSSSSASSTEPFAKPEPAHPVTNALLAHTPRRTSFGANINPGSRFSALSAFGFMSSGLSSSPPPSFSSGTKPPSVSEGSGSESLSSSPTAGLTSTQREQTQAPAPPAKRHLCMPDGMGGTMCLEIKDRSRRGSSVN